MRREYHGGQNARDWRRKVAALAHGQKESVLTYKFKLDVQDGDIDFDAAARTYDVTEGIAQGSLIGLVCAVHLSGFRLFSKAAETRRFVNRSRYPKPPLPRRSVRIPKLRIPKSQSNRSKISSPPVDERPAPGRETNSRAYCFVPGTLASQKTASLNSRWLRGSPTKSCGRSLNGAASLMT